METETADLKLQTETASDSVDYIIQMHTVTSVNICDMKKPLHSTV